MLNEQHGPAPQEDQVLLLSLGALALARRIREWIEREAPDESAPEERPSAVSADGAQVPPEIAAWLGLLALGARVDAWLARSPQPEEAVDEAARLEPSASLDLLR